MTPNGKVDRRALPSPEHSCGNSESTFVAPRTAMERSLTAVWGEVLKLERVGIRSIFFDLGGHSLLARQSLSRVRKDISGGVTLTGSYLSFPPLRAWPLPLSTRGNRPAKAKRLTNTLRSIPFQTWSDSPVLSIWSEF